MKCQLIKPKRIYQALMDDMNRERFAVHGSAFTISNKTILLVGPSGVGKSTLRNYLIHALGGLVIQDDKQQLLMYDGVLSVTGNPYVSDNCLFYSESIFTLDTLYILIESKDFYMKKSVRIEKLFKRL
jgi:energy-coupling factor transporter ATP-binding protein EcfA2